MGLNTTSAPAFISSYINEKMLRKTINDINTKINNKRHKCLNPDCSNSKTQKCHTISKRSIKRFSSNHNDLKIVKKNMFEAIFPGEKGRNFFCQFSINDDPTFKGFCNDCDTKLFYDTDNYIHIKGKDIPNIVLLQMHYRQVCYGIIELEYLKITNEELLKYTRVYHPGSKSYEILKDEIIPKTLAIYDLHLKVKKKCEYYLEKIKLSDRPLMPKIILIGDKTNPVCFGRVGYYAYQYAYSEEKVISQFCHFLPFATFSSVIGEQGESHLVFTSLPEDASHLVPIIRIIDRENWKDIIANLIYNFSDGCFFKTMRIETNNAKINKTLNYFIENSGLEYT
ncbi:hypothetical protein SC122_12155 [Legionella pneumophila serogroup 1]|uniref:hypothetical protein n=1 Tax=Legionella pneumophila TaxID=446 RepID=UPI0007706FB1|nr:hypothetical protein [Legionella pneumophila]HAT8832001.1 hypothetical protein [Legionella pneumophila subsp. pneumophila]QIB25583.1 hypothetical protein GCO85_14735 [Legionella pneumophila]CZH10185.1 Uncharacterised protein [Legionella pneumophila]HAT1965421.1 hypothetical protein [Legionella pneumophila]HAT1991347.1 hypothetical protein [Legionella pneumophila]